MIRERNDLEIAVKHLSTALGALNEALAGQLTGQALTDAQQAQTKATGAFNNARKAAQRVLVDSLIEAETAAAAARQAAQDELQNLP